LYCCKLPTPQLSSTHALRHRWRRRRAPVVGPLFGAEEAPSHEVLTSRDSHQLRKTGSSPIRNIGRRSPPSLFNTGSRVSAIPPLRQSNPPPSSANTQQSEPPHTKSSRSLPLHQGIAPDRNHSNSLDSTILSPASATPPASRDMDWETTTHTDLPFPSRCPDTSLGYRCQVGSRQNPTYSSFWYF
jgi:hypothetical protein